MFGFWHAVVIWLWTVATLGGQDGLDRKMKNEAIAMTATTLAPISSPLCDLGLARAALRRPRQPQAGGEDEFAAGHPKDAYLLIKKLDTKKAEAIKGVRAVVTWEDVPRLVYGHLEALGIPGDEPLMAKDEVRYKGQPIAFVAAEDEETAQAAVEAIEIDLDERPALFDVRKAADPDAPQIHQWGNWYPHFENEMDRRQIRKGDIDWAFEHADTIVQGVYRPAAIEQRVSEVVVRVREVRNRERLLDFPSSRELILFLSRVAHNKVIDEIRRRLVLQGRNINREVPLEHSRARRSLVSRVAIQNQCPRA
jgi:hypothetical protein